MNKVTVEIDEILWEALKNSAILVSKGKLKPKLKKIDMSVAISSGIDCEFSNGKAFIDGNRPIIRKLSKIGSNEIYFMNDKGNNFSICRPRMNHIHACPNGFDKCPLPYGFQVKIYFRDGEYGKYSICDDMRWSHESLDGDIIAFEVTGIAEGWEL